MELRIIINLDNAAFEDDPGPEVKRILAELVRFYDHYPVTHETPIKLRDINGNTVGQAEFVASN